MEHQIKILNREEVSARTGYSRSSIYAKLDPKSSQFDLDWPHPVKFGGRKVGWVESEIEDWMQLCIAKRDAGKNAKVAIVGATQC